MTSSRAACPLWFTHPLQLHYNSQVWCPTSTEPEWNICVYATTGIHLAHYPKSFRVNKHSYKHSHIDIDQPYKYFGLQTRSWSRTDSMNVVFHFYCFELVSIAIIVSMAEIFSSYERSSFGFVEILFAGQETREHWVLHTWLILLYLDSRNYISFLNLNL